MTKTTPGAMRATKGPWKLEVVEKWPYGVQIIAANGNVVLAQDGFAHSSQQKNRADYLDGVGFSYKDGQRYKACEVVAEQEANARLMAASWEMLEALQALMDEYKQRMDGDYPGENLHQFQSAYKMARAAISAATGEAENG